MMWRYGEHGDPGTVIQFSAGNFYRLVALLRFIGRLIRAGNVDLRLISRLIDDNVGRDRGDENGARR